MRRLLAALMVSLVAACGGGGGGSSSGGGGGGGGSGQGPSSPPPTASEAARFLTQATFGPTEASIAQVQSQGFNGWITAQIAMPLPGQSHLSYLTAIDNAQNFTDPQDFYESWWRQVITSEDQLRQRVAFALSQIFVISMAGDLDERGAASYYDMLQRNAFGNFRTLLEDVTLHPMMGEYLTFIANQKEDPSTGRMPDENYAREVMQLMTIGLHELNTNGTARLSNGQPIPTYASSDIAGLAKVFTGISYYNTNPSNNSFRGGNDDPDMTVRPMIFYPNFHSTSEKSFLGVAIPASSTVDVAGDLRIALDRLFQHPNVGPFIAQRLIQQLVTSNPSPAYVSRVATVFNDNGSGVRGDMAAVVRAVLTDSEARDMSTVGSASFGKLREPLIRVANWARAFKATSQTGTFLIPSTASNTYLGQAPLFAPSVFNFWRPGFTPPATTQLGQRTLVAPEFQVIDEVTVASYANLIQDTINAGIGFVPTGFNGRDVLPNYSSEIALADSPQALVDRVNLLLLCGQMSPTLQQRIVAGVSAINVPASTGSNQATIDVARLNRVKTAIFFTMISPEYLVQR